MRVFEGMTGLCPPAICPNANQAGHQGTTGKGQDPVDQGGFRRVARDSAHVWSQIVSPNASTEDPFTTLEEATVDAEEPGELGDPTDPSARKRLVQSYKRPVSLQRFLSSIGSLDPDEPALYFVHILMPHQPWKYLPSGLKYPDRVPGEGRGKGGRWASEPWPVRSNHQRHLLQVAYTDRLIGTVVKRLHDTGLHDPSLLEVTADHGMAFVPGQSSRAIRQRPKSPTPPLRTPTGSAAGSTTSPSPAVAGRRGSSACATTTTSTRPADGCRPRSAASSSTPRPAANPGRWSRSRSTA
jgi:arylsulfatase A-like enzyme